MALLSVTPSSLGILMHLCWETSQFDWGHAQWDWILDNPFLFQELKTLQLRTSFIHQFEVPDLSGLQGDKSDILLQIAMQSSCACMCQWGRSWLTCVNVSKESVNDHACFLKPLSRWVNIWHLATDHSGSALLSASTWSVTKLSRMHLTWGKKAHFSCPQVHWSKEHARLSRTVHAPLLPLSITLLCIRVLTDMFDCGIDLGEKAVLICLWKISFFPPLHTSMNQSWFFFLLSHSCDGNSQCPFIASVMHVMASKKGWGSLQFPEKQSQHLRAKSNIQVLNQSLELKHCENNWDMSCQNRHQMTVCHLQNRCCVTPRDNCFGLQFLCTQSFLHLVECSRSKWIWWRWVKKNLTKM